MQKYNAIILGAGPAGYTCAIRLAQLGQSVALVERDYLGGICVNWGCTPSKAMIEAAKIARTVRHAEHYGIEPGSMRVDFGAIAMRRDMVVEHSRKEIGQALARNNVTVLQGEGEVLAPGSVRVHHGRLDRDGMRMERTGETTDLTADHIVIATGSAPMIPPGFSMDDPSIVSSNRLISIEELPPRLTIVGGGIIGLEFATIFSNLGSKVTVVEFCDRVLPWLDQEMSDAITAELTKAGVDLKVGYKVLSIEKGTVRAENQKTKAVDEWASGVNLIAVGRRAVIDEEHCKKLGLTATPKGIDINDHLQTNLPGIWAVGDSTGKSILAHVGIQQGILCAENIVSTMKNGPLQTMHYDVIPSVIYTLPEIATVGTVPKELDGVTVARVPFTANLRAAIEEHTTGYAKVWIKNDRLLAAQIIGVIASEIIQEFANMIALGSSVEAVSRIIHAHPTYAEICRTVLEHALGRAIEYHEEKNP